MSLLNAPIGRFSLLILGLVEFLFFSGIHYGFNPLIPVYKKLGVYCDKVNETVSSIPNNDNTSQLIIQKTCVQEINHFNYAFIVWTISQCFVTLPVGSFFDHFGISITKTTGAVLFFLGCLCYGFTSQEWPHFIYPAGCLISASNQFLMLSNLLISHLFPRAQNLVVSIFCGAFDSSSVVMALIALGFNSGISVLTSFLVLGFAGLILMPLTTLILMPRRQEDMSKFAPTSPPEKVNVELDRLQDGDGDAIEDIEVRVIPDHQAELLVRYPTLKSCICSRFYFFHLVFFSFILLRFSFFLTALFPVLVKLYGANSPSFNRLLSSVNFFLFSGIFVAPLAGFLIDISRIYLSETETSIAHGSDKAYWRDLRPLAIPTFICSAITVLLSCLVMIPSEGVTYLTFALLALCRGFLFSSQSASLLMAFPLRFFGKLFGLAFLVGGVISMLQYVFLQLATDYFTLSNVALILISAVSFTHPIQIFIGSRSNNADNINIITKT